MKTPYGKYNLRVMVMISMGRGRAQAKGHGADEFYLYPSRNA
jgi:hypothetical protein